MFSIRTAAAAWGHDGSPSSKLVSAMHETLATDEITALLGRGTRFEGKLHFEGCVRIEGSFSGEILSDDTLVVGEGAVVDGEILAGTVIIRGGSVSADVRATRTIELHAPSIVTGNLRAPEVYIDKGARFSGTCTMGPVEPEEGGLGLTRDSASQSDN